MTVTDDDVLDAWAAGRELGRQIAARLGIGHGLVKRILRVARRAGDERAAWRGQGRRQRPTDG